VAKGAQGAGSGGGAGSASMNGGESLRQQDEAYSSHAAVCCVRRATVCAVTRAINAMISTNEERPARSSQAKTRLLVVFTLLYNVISSSSSNPAMGEGGAGERARSANVAMRHDAVHGCRRSLVRKRVSWTRLFRPVSVICSSLVLPRHSATRRMEAAQPSSAPLSAAAEPPLPHTDADEQALSAALFGYRSEEPSADPVSVICAASETRGALLLTAFVHLSAAVVNHDAGLVIQCAEDFAGQAHTFHRVIAKRKVEVVELLLKDDSSQCLDRAFERSLPQIAAARDRGVTVCVNCVAGISRSSTIVLAHLLEDGEGSSLQDALLRVRAARPRVFPNPGFLIALLKREAALRGRPSIPWEVLVTVRLTPQQTAELLAIYGQAPLQ